MAVPTWLSAAGHLFSDILGGVIGAQVADLRGKATQEVAAEVRRVFLPDREDVMKELLFLGDGARELIELLKKANRDGFVTVHGKRYTENWIVTMLLKIEPEDRQWVYSFLNEAYTHGEEEFFTLLEILHNDGVFQWLQVAKAVAGKKLRSAIAAADLGATELNVKLQPTRDKLRARAEKKGWRAWLD